MAWEGSAVQYRTTRVLRTGGFLIPPGGGGDEASNTAWFADLGPYAADSTASVDWDPVPFMNQPRAQHNLVVLPDGRVIAFGGWCGPLTDPDGGCESPGSDNRQPEIFTEAEPIGDSTWDLLPPSQKPRYYHSTALLLYDGRILVAGGGFSPAAPDQPSAELYYPSYLYDAAGFRVPDIERASFASAPPLSVKYGQTFTIAYSGENIFVDRAVLMGVGATTHHFDGNQRYVPLEVIGTVVNPITGQGSVTLRAPATPEGVPPGPYMLFPMHEEPGTNDRTIMGKACYLTLSDQRDVVVPINIWKSVGTLEQGSSAPGTHWAKVVKQGDNQRYHLRTDPEVGPDQGVINVTGTLAVAAPNLIVDGLDVYIQHSAKQRSFPGGGDPYALPNLKLKVWGYANASPNDTTGAFYVAGTSVYSTDKKDRLTKITVVPSLTLQWLRLAKYVTSGSIPEYRFKLQIAWQNSVVNPDPLGYQVTLDQVGWRIAYHHSP